MHRSSLISNEPKPLLDTSFNGKFIQLAEKVDQQQLMRHPSQLCLSEMPSIANFKIIHTPMFEKIIPRIRQSKDFGRKNDLEITLCDEELKEKPGEHIETERIGDGRHVEGKGTDDEHSIIEEFGKEEEEEEESQRKEDAMRIEEKSEEVDEEKRLVKQASKPGRSKLAMHPALRKAESCIKITLSTSDDIFGFYQQSTTVLRDSVESQAIEEDNQLYEYMTTGKGSVRRTSEAEAQTKLLLLKTRDVNTNRTFHSNSGASVTTYQMWKTNAALQLQANKSAEGEDDEQVSAIEEPVMPLTGAESAESKLDYILSLGSFQLAMMQVTRILASGEYGEGQRRYRNMTKFDPLVEHVDFKYRLKVLFTFQYKTLMDKKRKAVSDMSFCPNNGDIIAVAYGIYSYAAAQVPQRGECCIWNIKNPVNPERVYDYTKPVVAVAFSPYQPQLIAVGLYDGSVQVIDITHYDDPPIACSVRTEQATVEPITSIKWLPIENVTDKATGETQQFLALSQDGNVTKYRIINSPNLLSYPQMQLDRVEGSPEGLYRMRLSSAHSTESNRQPQGLNLVSHPAFLDIYYILTDEGCIHKCSTNSPHQHLEIYQTHHASVSYMDFSPWSPKLYLTCGNDWYIRIWLDGIHKPLITLKDQSAPINCAAWSRTHSTIIIALTRSHIQVWDLRRDLLKPCSLTNLDKSYFTMFKFSPCGNSILVGNERGNAIMLAFEDMPFAPHFQYRELERAIQKAIVYNDDLVEELKSTGYFGYPETTESNCSESSSILGSQ